MEFSDPEYTAEDQQAILVYLCYKWAVSKVVDLTQVEVAEVYFEVTGSELYT